MSGIERAEISVSAEAAVADAVVATLKEARKVKAGKVGPIDRPQIARLPLTLSGG